MAEETVTSSIQQESVIYRRYVKYGQVDSDGQGTMKTVIVKSSILAETEKKEPATIKVKDEAGNSKEVPNPYAGLPSVWAEAERDGFELFSENKAIIYSAKSLEALELLSPDPAIRLYIYQTGLSSIQTARANAFAKALDENAASPTPLYNGETLDLQSGIGEDGEFSFNKQPSKRGLTDEDKMVKLLKAQGKTDAQIQAILAIINATATE
jgi:hypothetical protein